MPIHSIRILCFFVSLFSLLSSLISLRIRVSWDRDRNEDSRIKGTSYTARKDNRYHYSRLNNSNMMTLLDVLLVDHDNKIIQAYLI